MTESNSEDPGRTTILVPLDGSSLADRALELAKDFALQRAAKVTLLQVIDSDTKLSDSLSFLASKAEFFKMNSVACEGKSLVGTAEDVIVKESHHADLMVMSSHGHSQFDRLILGSTTEKVIRRSGCDVLVLREEQPRLREIRKILLPLDGHWLSHQALPIATKLCTDLGADLVLARVNDADKLTRNLSAGKEESAKQMQYLEKVASEVGDGVKVETAQEFGGVARGLLKIAEGKDVDLVVMTSHGRGGFNRWVNGSVTEALLRASSTPVMVVRSRPKESPAITPILLQPTVS